MKIGILFSGGKDSMLAAYIAKQQEKHEVVCLISVISENKESYMFHIPSIIRVEKQAEVMKIPLIIQQTKGEKEEELVDLEIAIRKAIEEYDVQGIVTGAIESVYQASRIRKICKKLGLKCISPLWHKNQLEILEELIEKGFKVIITGVFAEPFDKSWLGREINNNFIKDMKLLNKKYKINMAGEGGEFETFVLNCPLFKKELKVKSFEDFGEKNSWRREIAVV